ncbi:LysM peptidoglycan-binding domain-containing protein [Burkholderia cepacia]|uniref:RHS Repeat family protein n=1 Tax=Burkholderia cepacia TaxID=292 RepID=A0AA88Z107_BURCE|nr:LysM peptidoglycan-binding domain-containing protein [Burkholderia cepacia]KGB98446.1 RHS Repeat family protein [Burkholderia cepacia]
MVSIVTGNGLGLQSSSALGLGGRGQIGSASFGQTGEQIYVNAANGNLVIQDRDQLLLGQGVNSAIYRAYNSLGQLPGDNWRPGGTRTVDGLTGSVNTAESTVTLTDWDGSTIRYTYDATRKLYVATSSVSTGVRPTLSFDAAANAWNWRDGASQITEIYDASHGGRLTSSRDRDGNTVNYMYNAAGLLTQVATAGGDVTYLDYNISNQLIDLRTVYRDAKNQLVTATTVRYAYDAQGRLSTVTVDLSPEDNSIADGKVFTTTYTYDGTSSRVASIAQSDGSRVAFTYRLVGSDYRVATIAQTADTGVTRVTALSYDAARNQTTITDPLGLKTVLTYDASGRLLRTQSANASGPVQTQTFSYDDANNVVTVRGSNGELYRYGYDSRCNLVHTIDEHGTEIWYTYGANNEVLTEQVWPSGGAARRTTRYVYDTNGHLRFVMSPEGRVTEFRYNAAGQRVSEIAYSGAQYDVGSLGSSASVSETILVAWVTGIADKSRAVRTDTTYDYRGNVASVTQYGKLLADGTGDLTAGAGEVSQIRYVYDAFGRLLQRYVGPIDKPQVEQFTYDGLGRLLTATRFDGALTLYQYDDTRHTVSVTFSNGLTRTSTYNAAGELISVAESSAGRVLSQVQNAYDAAGRLRMTTDANGLKTHYLYNELGQRVAQIGPDGALSETAYAPGTNLVVRTTVYSTRLTSEQLAKLVDDNGRPVQMTAGKALTLDNANLRPVSTAQDRSEWRFYVETNRLDHTVDADGTVMQYRYDDAGHLIATTTYANRLDVGLLPDSNTVAADTANDRTIRYFYDNDGLLRGQLDAQGYLSEYRYNAAGERIETIRYSTATNAAMRASGTLAQLIPATRPQDIREQYLYDAQGRLRAEIDGEGFLTSYQYDALGNVTQRTRGRQIATSQLSAPQQVPVTFRAKGAPGTTVEVWIDGVKAGTVTLNSTSDAAYTVVASNVVPIANHTIEFRSPGGAQVSIEDALFGNRPFAATGDAVITGSVGGNPTQESARYTLDAAQTAFYWASLPGELEQTSYAYDAMGRLIERTTYSVSGNATTTYAYDDQGNLTNETTGDRTSTHRYDEQGHLIGQLSGEGSAALVALGASATQAQIDAVWKSWGVSYGYDASGLRTSMTDANGNRTLYYYDTAGHLTHVVNPLGEVTEYQYDTFGDVTQTIVYATRTESGALGALAGGLLTDALKTAFTALGNDGQASRTRFAYSATGRLLLRTDARGFNTEYTYNPFGELTSLVQEISSGVRVRTSSAYDKRGNLLVRQNVDPGGLNLLSSVLYDAFGRVIQSTDANGVVRSQQYDRNGNVVVVTDGTGSQTKLTYDAFGNVLNRTDNTGNTTTYTYSAFNREVTVTTPEGIRTTTAYNAFGQLITLTDGRGNATQYQYDLDGHLTRTTDATGATAAQSYDRAGQLIDTVDARGIHTVYRYDAAGRVLTRTVDPVGLNLVTRYEYDAKGQLTRTTDPSGVVTETRYDLNGQKVAVITDVGGLNLTTTFAYDGQGNVVTVTEGVGSAHPRVTQNVYDKAGRLTSTIVDPAGLKLTTNYRYDKNGNVIAATDAAGGTTRYTYDAENRPIWSVGPTGAVVKNLYDAQGRLVMRQAFAAPLDLSGLPATLSDADIMSRLATSASDQITRFAYDTDGRVVYTINGMGNVTGFTYDANGNVTETAGYAGAIAIGGVVTAADVTAALEARGAELSGQDRVTHAAFDAANRALYTIDPAGAVTANRYDANGNLLEQTQIAARYSGATTEAAVTAWQATSANRTADRTTTWAYDASNRPAYVIDAEGYVTASRYDAAGRLVSTVRYGAADALARGLSTAALAQRFPASAPADAAVTQYRYDAAGRLSDTVDALGFVTHYVLDALGQPTETIVAYGTAQAVTTHRDYDAAGNLVQETRASGTPIAVTTRYVYDAMGRLLQLTDPRGVELITQDTDWAVAQRRAHGVVASAADLTDGERAMLIALYSTRYTYDANGQIVTETDPLGYTVTHEYDAFGNRISTTNRNGHVMRFEVDAANRVVATYGPGDAVVRTEYNAFGDTVKVTQGSAVTTLAYDQLGRLIQSTDAMGYSERYGYDAFGNRTSYTNKLGGQFSYTYDRLGRKTSETLPILSGRQPVVNRFEYDARGNLTKTIEAAGLSEARTISYVYDLLDRQTQIIRTAHPLTSPTATPTETRTYDAQGNVTSITDPNGAQTRLFYDALNRLIAQVSPTGTYSAFEYDGVGNRVRERVFADRVSVPVGTLPSAAPAQTDKTRETRYVYDADNRLIESRVMNVTTGRMSDASGNTYDIASNSTIVRTWRYDGEGHVVIETDPYDNPILHYYDSQGSEILRIDALGYGVAWQRDANGNVLQETQFAQRYQDAYSVASDPFVLMRSWQRNGDDRITNYEWDLNGRMTSETRAGVRYASVDGNGRLIEQFGDARTQYTYDAEGHLLRKLDANGSQYDFTYDLIGRMTEQKLPQFADYQNRMVRATTQFVYDGVGHVIREDTLGAPGDRSIVASTTYGYNGDRLYYSGNGEGGTEYFTGYDAAGNVTLITYTNVDADGRTVDVRTSISYDAEGHEISRVTRTYLRSNNTLIEQGPTLELQYNAFGEVIARRTSVGTLGGVWQEYAEYDNAGHVVRTNFDDGVSHVFMYDKNGNATLKVESMQADLRTYAIDDILKDVQLNQTFTKYDARNQVVQITQPKVWMGAPQVTFRPVDIDIEGGNFADTLLTVKGWLDAPTRPIDGPATSEELRIASGGISAGVSVQWRYVGSYVEVSGMSIDIPDLSNLLGAYQVEVVASYEGNGTVVVRNDNGGVLRGPFSVNNSTSIVLPPNSGTHVEIPINDVSPWLSIPGGGPWDTFFDFGYTIEIYVTPLSDPSIGRQSLGTVEKSARLYDASTGGTVPSDVLNASLVAAGPANVLTFADSTLGDGMSGAVYYRPLGSNGPFAQLNRMQDGGASSFRVDASSLAGGTYEMWYVSTRPDGRLERRDQYTVTIPASGQVAPNPIDQRSPYTGPDVHFDATGTYFWRAPGVFDVYSLQASNQAPATSAQLRIRTEGTNDGWTTLNVARDAITGAFPLDFSGLGAGDYDVELVLFDGLGQTLDIVEGPISLRDGQPPTVAFNYLSDKRTTVTFTSQPAAAEWILLTYEGNGLKETIRVDRLANGEFVWDARALLLGADSYTYAITFTAYDATGTPLTMSRGNVTIGEMTIGGETGPGLTVELTGSETPSILQFSPVDANNNPVAAATLKLYYRPAPKTVADYDAEYDFIEIHPDAQGRYQWDASSLPTQVDYEYYYLALDAEGNVLADREGFFNTGTRNNPATNVEIDQQIRDTETRRDLTIDRFQTYNAFGEVASEIWLTQKQNGAIGEWQTNVRELYYNTQGNLILKREPTVSITLANGFQMDARPETTFYYDRTGNLVGLLDANGNLSTHQWNYGLAQPAVARVWDAQGNGKSYGYDVRGDLRVYTDELGRRTDYTYDQWHHLTRVDRPVLANGQRSTERYEYDRAGNRIATTDAMGARSKVYYDSQGRVTRTVSAAGRTVSYNYQWASNIRSVGTNVGGGWVLTTTDANGMTSVDQMDIYGRVTWHRDLGGHTFVYEYNWAGLLARQSSAETGQDIEYDYYSNGMVWKVLDHGTGTEALYEYDANGNRTQERFRSIADNYVFARTMVEYDAMNRVTAIRDLKYNVYYEYDAVGNRRRMLAEYHDLLDNHQTYQEYWYEYDALNRFTVSMGQLSTGQRATSQDDTSVSIVIGGAGSDGVQLGYNAAGERTLAHYASDGRTEIYAYDANGFLATQTINGKLYAERTNDLTGRVTRYTSYDQDGTTRLVDLARNWDADGQLMSERDDVAQQTTTYTRMADGTVTRVDQRPTSGSGTSVSTTYTYEWWDSAKQKTVVSQADNPSRPGWKPARSLSEYDVNGNLKTVYDDGGEQADKSRMLTYWTDQQGQVLRRDELVQVRWGENWQVLGAGGDYKHEYYYLNGHRVGNVGNDGVDHVDYVQELAGQLGTGSDDRYKIFKPISTADFDENFMRIDNAYPGPAAGSWTARGGDTLQSIAAAVWGDASLWYILADANGLKGEDTLKTGQILKIPNKVTNVHNTSDTFKPYDPGKAIGNTQPTLPDPPPPPGKNGGCGGLASIIAVVVAVVATVYTAGAAAIAMNAVAAGTSTFAAGAAALTGGLAGTTIVTGVGLAAAGAAALGGAVGAAASQGFLIAAGAQSGFDWKGVALGTVSAAAGSGVGQALGSAGLAGQLGQAGKVGQIGLGATVGAGTSGVSQGVGALTGLQHGFDWKGVAASAVAAGVGSGIRQTVFGQIPGLGQAGAAVAAGTAGTLVRGGSLSRNIGAVTMDAIASTVGNMVVDQVQGASVAKNSVPSSTDLLTQQAIAAVNGQVLPGAIGGVGSGFMPLDTSYNGNVGLFGGVGGVTTLDAATSAASVDALAASRAPYSASSLLFGPSMGFPDRERPIMLADAGGNPENTLLAWRVAAGQIASDTGNYVKGLANTPTQFVNGALALGHAAVRGGEAIGLLPPGAGAGSTPQIPYFQTDGGFAARSGNATGFALTMFGQIPEQLAMKTAGVLDAALSRQAAKASTGETVTVYRVDDIGFAPRISSDGTIPIVTTRSGNERALFVNIGQPQRAQEFALVNRGGNATVTAVDADASILERLRATAVYDKSRAATLNPTAPLVVDVNKAVDQFGLRTSEQIQWLRDAIKPGTARIIDPKDLK